MIGLMVDVALGLLVLIAANFILDPVPLAAATVWVGALGLSWIAASRPVLAAVGGAALGAIAGAGFHFYSHLAGRSTEPPEGIPLHVLADAGLGLLIGSLALLASCARILWRRKRHG